MKLSATLILCLLGLTLNAQNPKAPVTVTVKDPDGVVIPNDKIIFKGKKTGREIIGITDAKGTFLVHLPAGDTYDIKISVIGDDLEYNTIEIPTLPANATFQDMALEITYWMGDSFVLSNLNFETGRATIQPGSYSTLNKLADHLKRKKGLKILIAGHTDNIGNAASNVRLSKDRANAVRAYLLKKGLSAARISTKGYGMDRPIADNATPQGRAENRRTEIQIIE